jgi:hypothetical protein
MVITGFYRRVIQNWIAHSSVLFKFLVVFVYRGGEAAAKAQKVNKKNNVTKLYSPGVKANYSSFSSTAAPSINFFKIAPTPPPLINLSYFLFSGLFS